jgi:SMI1 / KNR4 family (SUKH-1)
MVIKDSNRFGKLEPQVLNDFTTKHKLKLPNDYKQFLLEHNGGQPIPWSNKIIETNVSWLYGIHQGEYWSNLEAHIEMFEKRIPAKTLPISSDAFGNLFLLSLRKDTFGEIWFWDHENEAEKSGKKYFDNITKAGDSFTEFIENLYEYVDPDETAVDKIIRENDLIAFNELLNSGYDIETKDEYDRTFIENASISNRIEMVKILIEKKANINESIPFAKQNMEAFPTDGYEPLVQLLMDYKEKK